MKEFDEVIHAGLHDKSEDWDFYVSWSEFGLSLPLPVFCKFIYHLS